MGLFKSEQEKQAEREDRNSVIDINNELSGTSAMELGNMLSFDEKTAARLNTYYLNALIKQNWIIIRLLDELNNSK